MGKLVKLTVAAAFGLALQGTPKPAVAGCQINVFLKNTGSATALAYFEEAHVKRKLGTWRKLRAGGWMDPSTFPYPYIQAGEETGDGYQAVFSCSAPRQYRVKYQCTDGALRGKVFTAYSGWTTAQNRVVVQLSNCAK